MWKVEASEGAVFEVVRVALRREIKPLLLEELEKRVLSKPYSRFSTRCEP